MSNFEDFGGKVTFEKASNGEPAHLTINFADVTRDEFKELANMRRCNDQDAHLPCCDIDFEPHKAEKLLHVLERKGFDVDIDKENRTIEISKDKTFGSHHELLEGLERKIQAHSENECGENIKHPVRHALRQSLIRSALRYD